MEWYLRGASAKKDLLPILTTTQRCLSEPCPTSRVRLPRQIDGFDSITIKLDLGSHRWKRAVQNVAGADQRAEAVAVIPRGGN
jgi:hypothetical protein